MLATVTVALAATMAAGLTLYSGFGLGTILMPVFSLFFPLEVAVASTAVVHAANSVFKVAVVGRLADIAIVLRFGIPAVCAAFVGAMLLGYLSNFEELAGYSLGPIQASVTPVKLSLGALMIAFAVFELAPRLKQLQFDRKYLAPGWTPVGIFRRTLRSSGCSAVCILGEGRHRHRSICRHERRCRILSRLRANCYLPGTVPVRPTRKPN